MAAGRDHAGAAALHGVRVQKMAPAGVEFILGVLRDPTFGPIVMAGFGGVAVELFRDVAYRPAPLDAEAAAVMLRSLRSAPLLDGFRGRAKIPVEPLADLIARVSAIAAGFDELAELELNPVILHADGSGLTIADALLTVAEAPGGPAATGSVG
jgi:hypothetical protein